MIDHRIAGNVLIITIHVETMREPELVNQIKDAMSVAAYEAGLRFVIIDLQKVQYVGSVGLLAFLAMRRIPAVQTIVLAQLNPNVRELFQLCRLISTSKDSAPFRVEESVEAAIETISPS